MTIEMYIVLAIVLIGWYVLSDKKKEKVEEKIESVPTLDKVLSDTETMYENSTERICKMFEKSRKEIGNIHKVYMQELKSNKKITIKESKANVK